MSLDSHLATLDRDTLAALLRTRPDVLVAPAPRDLRELAQRLCGVASLATTLDRMDADEVVTLRALAFATAVGGPPSVRELAAAMRADAGDVAAVVARLAARAVVWVDGGQLGLPERLAAHLLVDLERFRPVAQITRQALAEDVRAAVVARGGAPRPTKAQASEQLAELLRDADAITRAVRGLSESGRRYLDVQLSGLTFGLLGEREFTRPLVRSGLMIGMGYRGAELPREVAAVLLLQTAAGLVGAPDVRESGDREDDGRAAAEATVVALTGLLDAAAEAPLPALKKGGIGVREQARMGKRLGAPHPALLIDLAAELGLLETASGGYAAVAAFGEWREQPLARRWSAAARTWFELEWSPTSRESGDGEVSPPVPMASGGGVLRRALLRAAAGGRSLRDVAAGIEWFCPTHGYVDVEPDPYDEDDQPGATAAASVAGKVAAALREAELLGVVSGDRLTTLGERLVESAGAGAGGVEHDLADTVAGLLPESRATVVLQSDLSAVAAGQVSAAAVRVLAAAATPEAGGTATIWRFSPTSVRAALDAGATADGLRADLVAASGRELPQPLDYLIGDVARRHGGVRVRETRCCVTATAAEIDEIRHTRSLGKLELRKLAPTVLTSPAAPDAVLAALRRAGWAPMPEDADGVVVVPARASGPAPRHRDLPQRATRSGPRLVDAVALAATLLAADPAAPRSATHDQLAALAAHLDTAEIALLADALDRGDAVRVGYRNAAGNHSVRDITPVRLWDRYLTSYCHLRSGERDFTITGIENVGIADG